MKILNLQIVTIEKKIYDEKVDSVVLPTPLGEAGVLPGHVPIVTSLSEGEIRIEKDKNIEYLSCTGGFAQIHPNKVIVLADAAEHADEIDIKRAEEAKKRAQETMKKAGITLEWPPKYYVYKIAIAGVLK